MVNVYIPEQSFDQNVHDQYFDNAKAGTLDVLAQPLRKLYTIILSTL